MSAFLTGTTKELACAISDFFMGYGGAIRSGKHILWSDPLINLLYPGYDLEAGIRYLENSLAVFEKYPNHKYMDYLKAVFRACLDKCRLHLQLQPRYQAGDRRWLKVFAEEELPAMIADFENQFLLDKFTAVSDNGNLHGKLQSRGSRLRPEINRQSAFPAAGREDQREIFRREGNGVDFSFSFDLQQFQAPGMLRRDRDDRHVFMRFDDQSGIGFCHFPAVARQSEFQGNGIAFVECVTAFLKIGREDSEFRRLRQQDGKCGKQCEIRFHFVMFPSAFTCPFSIFEPGLFHGKALANGHSAGIHT